MENKKRAKSPIKKYKKDCVSIIEIFLKMRKFKKRNYDKNKSDAQKKKKKRIYENVMKQLTG